MPMPFLFDKLKFQVRMFLKAWLIFNFNQPSSLTDLNSALQLTIGFATCFMKLNSFSNMGKAARIE